MRGWAGCSSILEARVPQYVESKRCCAHTQNPNPTAFTTASTTTGGSRTKDVILQRGSVSADCRVLVSSSKDKNNKTLAMMDGGLTLESAGTDWTSTMETMEHTEGENSAG